MTYALVNREKLAAEITAREKIREVGAGRKAFLARLADLRKRAVRASQQAVADAEDDDDAKIRVQEVEVPLITLRFGRALGCAVYNGDGDLAYARARKFDFPGIAQDVIALPFGSVPTNAKMGDALVPAGFIPVIGVGNTGKTPLSHWLAQLVAGDDNYAAIRVDEPMSGYASTHEQTACDIVKAMLETRVAVVDSVKNVLSAGDSKTKSGLSREAFVDISTWSSIACDTGTTIFAPLNPGSDSAEVLSLVEELAKSNATGIIYHKAGNEWGFLFRTGEGLDRQSGTFSFTKDGVRMGNVEIVHMTEQRILEVSAHVASYAMPAIAARTRTAKLPDDQE